MFSQLNKPRKSPRAGSHFAMAIALATGSAMLVGVVADPAQAQRDRKKKKEKEPKIDYSEAFVAVVGPLQAAYNAEGADYASLVPQIPAMTAAVSTNDDRFAAGQLVYNLGAKTNDVPLQLQGAEMMLASGKVPAENVAQYNFLAAQLAYNTENWAKARQYATAALELGYTQNSPQLIVSESFFADNQVPQGLDYLKQAIEGKIAAGETPPNDWIRRGLSQAYNNELAPQTDDFSLMLVRYYPDAAIWGDTIAIQRNLRGFEGGELLDLLRLARRTDSMRTVRDYEDYVDAADARRLPGEVNAVIAEGTSAGQITGANMFIADAKETAAERIRADRAELPTLEREANAASADLRTLVAAGDVFLSYDDYAKAETYYVKALEKPGADQATLLSRLGIAQLGQSKYDDAQATFAKVQGSRAPIAKLWAAYAENQANSSPNIPINPSAGGDTTESM